VVPGAKVQVEPDLPHRDRARMPQQGIECRHLVRVRRPLLGGMPPDGEEDVAMALGDEPVPIGVLDVEPDADDLGDPRGGGRLQRSVEQPALVQQRQMTVGVHQFIHRRIPVPPAPGCRPRAPCTRPAAAWR
jgi:hypothetical protein